MTWHCSILNADPPCASAGFSNQTWWDLWPAEIEVVMSYFGNADQPTLACTHPHVCFGLHVQDQRSSPFLSKVVQAPLCWHFSTRREPASNCLIKDEMNLPLSYQLTVDRICFFLLRDGHTCGNNVKSHTHTHTGALTHTRTCSCFTL